MAICASPGVKRTYHLRRPTSTRTDRGAGAAATPDQQAVAFPQLDLSWAMDVISQSPPSGGATGDPDGSGTSGGAHRRRSAGVHSLPDGVPRPPARSSNAADAMGGGALAAATRPLQTTAIGEAAGARDVIDVRPARSPAGALGRRRRCRTRRNPGRDLRCAGQLRRHAGGRRHLPVPAAVSFVPGKGPAGSSRRWDRVIDLRVTPGAGDGRNRRLCRGRRRLCRTVLASRPA